MRNIIQKITVLFAAVVILAGCAPIGITVNDSLEPDYAYVAGKKLRSDNGAYIFTDVRNRSAPNQWKSIGPKTSFRLPNPSGDAEYFIQKVKPGQYVFEFSFQQVRAVHTPTGFVHKGSSSSAAQLGVVTLEPGKINYIGVIDVQMQQIGSTVETTTYRAVAQTAYPEEEAKTALKKQYPQLAQDMDATFVVQRLR